MEWTGVMKLRQPIRTFKIEGRRSLGNPRALGKSRREVSPIYFSRFVLFPLSSIAVETGTSIVLQALLGLGGIVQSQVRG